MKIIYKLENWILKQYKFHFSWKFKYEIVKDLPNDLPEKMILIIAEGYQPDSLAFKCPCGCNALIYLNLLTDAKPCWKYRITPKRNISILPSIWRRTGCKSHFFIREGRVKWFY